MVAHENALKFTEYADRWTEIARTQLYGLTEEEIATVEGGSGV